MIYRALGCEIIDDTGIQIALVMPTNCTKKAAREMAKYAAQQMNNTAKLREEQDLSSWPIDPATPQPAIDAMAVLIDYADGRIEHTNRGYCPDEANGHGARDSKCPVCRAAIGGEAPWPFSDEGAKGK